MTQATRADVAQWGCTACAIASDFTWVSWAFFVLAVAFWIEAMKAAMK